MDELLTWIERNTDYIGIPVDEIIDHNRIKEQLKRSYMRKEKKYTVKLLEDVTTLSGVYIFLDKNNAICYVGKASNVRDRVRQHLTGNTNTKHIYHIFHKVVFIRCIEYEAKWIEKELILDFQPYLNKLGVTI